MLRPSFLVRRMGSAWLLVSCLMLAVVITTALVTALLSFYFGALPATVGRELVKSGTMSITVSDETSGSPARVTGLVSTSMRAAFRAVSYRQYRAIWSNDIGLDAAHAAGNVPALQAATMGGISAYADLTNGTWPSAPRVGQPIPVALPAGAAADLRLGVGSVLRLRYVGTGVPVSLVVTGLFRPRDPAAAYWRLDLIGPSGATVSDGFASYGPAVVSPAAFGGGTGRPAALQASDVSFVVLPGVAGIKPADLDGLAARLDAAAASLQNAGVSTVSTTMPQTLINVAAGLAAAKSLVVISGLQLLLLAAAALALAGRLLASQRDEETALLAARGAARWQLIRPSLAEGVLACAAAAAAGAIVGVRMAGLLLSRLAGPGPRQPTASREAWLGAAVLLLFCLAIVLWPALRPPGITAVRIRRGRQAAVASAVAAGADIALVALAVLSVHELLTYSAAGGSGINPVIAVAPALALAGLALIPLRLLPFAARGLEKLTARGRRLGAAMANWEISRRPVRQSGPALLVILAVGTSTLALAQYQSWQQSAHDQAAFATGAQVRVELATPALLSGVARIARLPDVTAAMPVGQEPVSAGQLLVIGAPQAPAVVTMRPDLSAVPLSQLWRGLDPRNPAGLALPGRPQRLEITASMAGGLDDQLGPVSATVTVQDAYGLAYTLSAGSMPADGRPHDLIAQLGGPTGPAYPLRLIGFALAYNMPFAPTSARAQIADAAADIRVNALSTSTTATGPFAAPFASGRSLAGWRPTTSAPSLSALGNLLGGESDRSRQPFVVSWTTSGGAQLLQLAPGSGPALPPSTLVHAGFTSLLAEVQVTIPPASQPVPLIATNAYLRATGLNVGSIVPINFGGTNIAGYVTDAVSQFPTITGSGIVADQAAVQDALVGAGGAPVPATAWWLSTADGAAPAGLPPGSTVAVAASAVAALQRNPVAAAPVQAARAVAAAAAVLAALGFCVSVVASARARRGQRALLAALGVPAAAQARLFCLEELVISGPAAVVGLALGIGLAHLLIPAVTLTATAGVPVPSVLVRLPLAWVVLIALAVPAIPVLAAAVTTLRQPDPAAELRAAEAAG